MILYELLCGRPPYDRQQSDDILAGIRRGQPSLPIELDRLTFPKALQAIALKAMERDPALRYPTARDMAADLERFLDGRPVLARPSVYTTTLGDRAATHLAHIDEWLHLRLIHPHEAGSLRAAYRALDARDDDWIVDSRALTYPQIALYLGAFLLVRAASSISSRSAGIGAVSGLVQPLLVLGLPFAGLNLAARWLHRRDHKAVAVAFYLAAVALLPLLLIIVFHETGFLVVSAGTPGQLFQDGSISNRQLQLTDRGRRAVGRAPGAHHANRRRSVRCSRRSRACSQSPCSRTSACARGWLKGDGTCWRCTRSRWCWGMESSAPPPSERGRDWLARPPYQAAAVVLVLVLELLALDGRTFHYLGFSLQGFQPRDGQRSAPARYARRDDAERVVLLPRGRRARTERIELQAYAARLLFVIAPFALLQPLGYLVRTGRVLAAMGLGVPRRGADHRRVEPAPAAAGLLLRGRDEYRGRAVADRRASRVVRRARVGRHGHRLRPRHPSRRLCASTAGTDCGGERGSGCEESI